MPLPLLAAALALAASSPAEIFRPRLAFTISHEQVAVPLRYALDSRGRLLVADVDRHQVRVFQRSGKLAATLGGKGFEEGALGFPMGLAAAADGSYWVSDPRAAEIKKYSADGAFLARGCPVAAREIVPLEDGFLAASISAMQDTTYTVARFARDCRLLWRAGAVAEDKRLLFHDYGLDDPSVVRGGNGKLYVSAAHSLEVAVLDEADGTELRRFSVARPGMIPPQPPPATSDAPPTPEQTEAARRGFHVIRKLLLADSVLVVAYNAPYVEGTARFGADFYDLDGQFLGGRSTGDLLPAASSNGVLAFVRLRGPQGACPCDVFRESIDRKKLGPAR